MTTVLLHVTTESRKGIIMHLSLALYSKDAVELQRYQEGSYLTVEIHDMKGKQLLAEAHLLQRQGYPWTHPCILLKSTSSFNSFLEMNKAAFAKIFLKKKYIEKVCNSNFYLSQTDWRFHLSQTDWTDMLKFYNLICLLRFGFGSHHSFWELQVDDNAVKWIFCNISDPLIRKSDFFSGQQH